jgi:hypothetical protein
MMLIHSCFCITGLQAQQSVVTSGGNAAGSNGIVTWSVGQVAYMSIDNSTGSINQGVQQPFEFFTVGINEYKEITLTIDVYPNPTNDNIILKAGTDMSVTLSYCLYDFTGKQLLNKKTSSTETNILLGNLPSAIYYLKVMDNTKELKTFKIIKN